ncbi:MAG TPA: hypothetical protein VMB79_06485 [Jatrophihabitans sp.]|nr:hypothetical protein [Jatrophihabitans sp.]
MQSDPAEPDPPETGESAHGTTPDGGPVSRDRLRPVTQPHTSAHIVYLDPKLDRPVSQYSPEGEIRMFGEFAAGLSRHGAVSRWMGIALMLVVLTPIVLSLLAIFTHW